MDMSIITVLPTLLVFSVTGVLLSCFCWRRHSRARMSSPSKLQSEDEKRSYQLSDELGKDESCEPHPFLPLSLYSGTAKASTTSYGQVDNYPENMGLLDNSFTLSNTCAGVTHNTVSHILIRQESNSHRNCELPPVPSGPDYRDPNILLSGKQSGSEVTGQLLAPEPSMSTMAAFAGSQVTTNEALISRLSFSDDPHSESDGLYASVGYSATGCSSVSRDNIPRDSNSGPSRTNKIEEHRQSVTDSAHAPYYSSVVSVVGCPTEYGEINGPVPPGTQSTPPLPDQTHQHCDLYARVRPRTERLPHQALDCVDPHASISVTSGITKDYSTALAPHTGVSQTADRGEPPIPVRGYGPSAIELVHQSRILSGSDHNVHNSAQMFHPGHGAESREYSSTSSRSSVSPDSNVPLIRRLLNAIQLINARHYHASDSSGSRSNQSTTGPYRKITVRESLASLRARNALPLVESVPTSTELQYERVYGVHGESASSATYEVVPGQESSDPTLNSVVITGSANGAAQDSGESQSKRLSDIYSEIPYTTCYALTFASPTGASCSASDRARGPDGEIIGSINTLERLPKSSVPETITPNPPNLFDSSERSDHTSYPAMGSPTANSELGSTASVLAEMQAFRHVDSEVDLTYARVRPNQTDHSRISRDVVADPTAHVNGSIMVSRSASQTNCKMKPQTSAERRAVDFSGAELVVNESINNHNLMPPLMERSMEEGSLQCLSHTNTPSISSSALSNLLNETEPLALFDSTSHAPNGPNTHTTRGLTGVRPVTDHHQFDYMLARMSASEANEWLQTCGSNGDPVTYDDVALS